MTKNVIGFFCGTGYTLGKDQSYAHIRDANLFDTLLGYDGCQVHGGGLFAHGVEEQADAFINDLKEQLEGNTDAIQINLVAHSRGVLSALLAIKKIQADPALKNRVSITADFRDPVPGNFQLTAEVAGNLAIANQVMDLTDCDVVKKVYITLQEKPILPIAFDSLVPKFHSEALIEIEVLPGYHDVQQRRGILPWAEHAALLKLGNAKTLEILREDGCELNPGVERDGTLRKKQLDAYNELVLWAKERKNSFGERDLHFGGKIVANNAARKEFNETSAVINWRHARLKGLTPDHVLYGVTQPHYNHRKTQLEHYCDLSQTLDKYLAKHPNKKSLVAELKQTSTFFLEERISLEDYKSRCQDLLKAADVKNKNINKSINYMCMTGYFKELDLTISALVLPGNPLYENLKKLNQVLAVELSAEIASGKNIDQLPHQSNAFKIAANTKSFIESIYSGKLTPEEIVKAAEQYANDNMRLGRNWSSGSKVIIGALICTAAAVIGCIVGAAIGLGIGFACGAITGPGAMITAIVGAFIGSFQGAMIAAAAAGAAVGVGVGAYKTHQFFKPSPNEPQVQVQALANAVKAREEAKFKQSGETSEQKDEGLGYCNPSL